MRTGSVILLATLALLVFPWDAAASCPTPKKAKFQVLQTYTRPANLFTQGLIFHEGNLYEGTGLYRKSGLYKVSLSAKEASYERLHRLSDEYFGEGIALFNGKLFQLTWKAGLVFQYDFPEIKILRRFSIPGQGWGLTQNESQLIQSNGSAYLFFRNPKNMTTQKQIEVFWKDRPLWRLNELEWAKRRVFANIYFDTKIAVIHPTSGCVERYYDLTGLVAQQSRKNPKADVLNGIAFDPKTSDFYVTGKLWPHLYRVRFEE